MYRGSQFRVTEAQEALRPLIGRFVLKEGTTVDQLAQQLADVQFALNIYPDAPKEVISKSIYTVSEDSDVVESVRFTIRPSSSHKLWIDDLHKVFTLQAMPDFFDKFITEFAQWADTWTYHFRLQTNLEALNTEVAKVIEEEGIPYKVSFTLGDGLADATDDHTVIGLSAEVIENLTNLPLFGDSIESRQEACRQSLADALKEANYGYDLLRSKSTFFKRDLGVYTRKSLNKLLRDFVNRRIQHVRVGIGHYDKDGVFAILERVAVSEEELASYDLSKVVVTDNKEPSSKEKEQNKTKIVTFFRLSPIDRETGVRVDSVTLEQAIAG